MLHSNFISFREIIKTTTCYYGVLPVGVGVVALVVDVVVEAVVVVGVVLTVVGF